VSTTPPRYRLAARTTGTSVFSLAVAQLALMGTAGLVTIGALTRGPTAGHVAVAGAAVVVSLVVAFAAIGGRPAYEVLPAAACHLARRVTKRDKWFARLPLTGTGSTPSAPGELPRCLDGLELWAVDRPGWAGGQRNVAPIGLVMDRRSGTATAAISVKGSEFQLVEDAEQHRRVFAWGRVLAAFARESSPVAAIAWHEWSCPAPLSEHLAWLSGRRDGQSPATEDYDALLDSQAVTVARHELRVTVTVRSHRRGRGGSRNVADTALTMVRALGDRCREAGLVASGLQFPEGPIAMPDGSVVLVEIKRRTLSRVSPEGEVEVIAELGGGPNGAAVGPDGAIYVCNNGGFAWHEIGPLTLPGNQPDDYSGGRIERVDPLTGDLRILFVECNGHGLRGPNDLVFDAAGGMWFTDHGKVRTRERDHGGIYYALPDGPAITEVHYPADAPNGIGLSPDGTTLYYAETYTGRVYKRRLTVPGQLEPTIPLDPSAVLVGLPGAMFLDSLAVDAAGNVCVGTLGAAPGVTVVAPDGQWELVSVPAEYFDPLVTNICFGGPDLRTAYWTCSATGRLLAGDWPRPRPAPRLLVGPVTQGPGRLEASQRRQAVAQRIAHWQVT
jgi:gluconolactonase